MKLSFFLAIISIFSVLRGYAQEGDAIHWKVIPNLTLQQGINSLDIELQNVGANAFVGYITLDLPPGLTSLGASRIAVQIEADKKRFLSIKLRPETVSQLKGRSLGVLLFEKRGQQINRKQVVLEVPDKRSVQLQDNSSVQYLRHIGDSIHMQLRVINTGTTDETLKVLLSSPDRVGKVTFQEIDVRLAAGSDTLLKRSFVVERYMMNLAQYTINVAGIYDNSDTFGNLSLLYSNIASDRNYQQMFAQNQRFSSYNPNYIALRVANILDQQQSYNFLSEGSYRLAGGRVRYGASVNRWGGDSRWNVNNTFLEYQKGRHGVTVGNIQESLEAPFYGRGATYSYQDTATKQILSVGLIERTHDLLGYYANNNPGFTAFARVQLADQDSEQKRYEGQIIYDQNGIDSVSSVMWTNRFDMIKPRHAESMRLEGFLGLGVQQGNGLYRVGDETMPSLAAGIKMNQQLRRWSYSSDNYYSTGYFPGNRRGAVQLNQRVNRRFRNLDLGLAYSYSDYRPQYLSSLYRGFRSGMSKWSAQFSFPFSPSGQISIIPSYNKEYADYMIYDDFVKLSSRSALIQSSISLRSKNLKHSLFLTVDGGDMSLDRLETHHFVFRTDLSYNYGRMGVFGGYQKGPFQVYDIMSAFVLGREIGERYSLGMRYQGDLLQRKITWNTSVNGQINEGGGKSFNGSLLAEYRVAKQTHLQTTLQYMYNMGVTDYRYYNANLQLGVRQQFRAQDLGRTADKLGNLNVFCYYDNNGNEIFDAGDEKAVDYGFMVRNILFVTNKIGEATFKKMPYGSYMLFFPLKNQYQGNSRTIDIDRKNIDLEVALQKVGRVSGQLLLDYDPALNMPTNTQMDMYTITARNENGRLYKSRSDARGVYDFHLPEGSYLIYPDIDSFPPHVYLDGAIPSIRVSAGKELKIDPFYLKVKLKKVDVKRFGNKGNLN